MSKNKKSQQSKPKSREIITLINPVFFSYAWVIIIKEEERFHLIAAKKNERIMDHYYRTLRGAQIAFSRIHSNEFKRFNFEKKEMEIKWTGVYKPDWEWLEKIINLPLKAA